MSELKPPDLRAEAFLLRPWRLDDLDQLVAAVQDPAVPRWTRVPEPYGLADGRAFIEATTKSWKDGTSAPFAVVDAADEQLLGSIGVRFHEEGAATVGYWIARESRGRGIATEALRLVSRWVLTALGVERLELVTEPANIASQRVAERAGFRREGLLRRYLVVKGERRDCVMFSLLRDDL
ncbi:MAG TPA: GNAT family protein [Gaiellaceae bacterium]|nr:GNAT family protein [Gaiellaceae bacterium]